MVVTRTECIGDYEGYTLTGKNNNLSYRVEIIRSNHGNRFGLTGMPECADQVEEIIGTYLRSYPQRDPDKAIPRVRKSLSYPRTIAELVYHGDELIGVGIFPRFIYDTDNVLYSSRFFLPEHTRQGVGTRIIENAILLHQQELESQHRSLRWLTFMTMNPYSLKSMWKLPMIGETWPIYYKLVDGQKVAVLNYYPQRSRQQWIMLRSHETHYMSSRNIDTITGVSKGELKELGMNESYRPSPDHQLAWQIHRLMVDYFPEGLEMHREIGDEMYTVCDIIKRTGSSEAEAPLPSAA